jgi:cytochrome c-type biogenesis protein CcmF
MTTSEAGIATLRMGQVYVTIAEQNADQSLDMRLYWKPYVSLIWLGGLIMALGGGLCLSDRRLRIGLGRAAANKGKQKPNAQPHPVAAAE